MALLEEDQCNGGCGRPQQECASSAGVEYCADIDDYHNLGQPPTWASFETRYDLMYGDAE